MALASAVRAAIRSVDPEQPVTALRPMLEIVEGSAAGRRTYMYLLATFATLSLGLAAFGVYGVMAYLVSSRTSEMAVRLALGAHPHQVRGLILIDGARLAATGLLIGAIGAVAGVRVLERVLYEVAPLDPIAFASAFATIAAAALAASLVPAVRATRINPVVALRAE
jgi:ABC-type antimicrobial peptide transport system permease subunit